MMIQIQQRKQQTLSSICSILLLLLLLVVVVVTTTQGFVVPLSTSRQQHANIIAKTTHKIDFLDAFPCYYAIIQQQQRGGRRRFCCEKRQVVSPSQPPPALITTQLSMTSSGEMMSPHRITTTPNKNRNGLIPPKEQYDSKDDKSNNQLLVVHHWMLTIGVFLWVLMLSLMWKPLPINMEDEGGYLMYYNIHNNKHPAIPNTEYILAASSTTSISSNNLQIITPITARIGFGGIGFGNHHLKGGGGGSSGFLPNMAFGGGGGGFGGMGFTVRNLPPSTSPNKHMQMTDNTISGKGTTIDLNVQQKQRSKETQEYTPTMIEEENQIKIMEQRQ